MPAWKPGETTNPKGINQYTGVQNVFRNLCKRDVYKLHGLLMDIVENQEMQTSARVAGLKFMLEAGFGRPVQSVEVNTYQGTDPDLLTTRQLQLAANGETEAFVLDLIASGKLAEIEHKFKEEPLKIEEKVKEEPIREGKAKVLKETPKNDDRVV